MERQPLSNHSYGLWHTWFPVAWGLLSTLFLLIPALGALRELEDVILISLPLTAIYFFLLMIMNSLPNIRVQEEGLQVQVFLLWWDFVPWDDILDLRDWSIGSRQVKVILVRKLTPAHRLIGQLYAGWSKPAFLIAYRISGYDELMDTIMTRTGLSDR